MDFLQLRAEIDRIDDKLISLFKQRMAIVEQVANYKKAQNLPTLDANREQEKIWHLASQLPSELTQYATPLYQTLFEISRHYQQQLK